MSLVVVVVVVFVVVVVVVDDDAGRLDCLRRPRGRASLPGMP